MTFSFGGVGMRLGVTFVLVFVFVFVLLPSDSLAARTRKTSLKKSFTRFVEREGETSDPELDTLKITTDDATLYKFSSSHSLPPKDASSSTSEDDLLLKTSNVHSAVYWGRGALRAGSVFVSSSGSFSVRDGLDCDHAVACGTYMDSVEATGWGVLRLRSSKSFSDHQQAYALGFLESFLTHDAIFNMTHNFFMNEYGSPTPPKNPEFTKFFSDLFEWQKDQLSSTHENPTEKEYWNLQQLLGTQFQGLVEGYAEFAPKEKALELIDLFLLNSAGDLETLDGILNTTAAPKREHYANQLMLDCSSLVQFCVGDDMYAGHTTWRDFYAMLRIYKFYTMNYSIFGGSPYVVHFSSSPGFLTSKDDFYVTHWQSYSLTVMETTNNVWNTTLLAEIKPQCVLSWQRAFAANALSRSGSEWTTYFALYNSGTYNNQWIVVDNSKFDPAKLDLPPGTLFILEQVPTLTRSADVTWSLNERGIWPSYNIPFFKEIYDVSGYLEKYAKFGDAYSYENCPRAKMFRRFQSQSNGKFCLGGIQGIMQYNDYTKDPLSLGDPMNGIAARGDLRSTKPVAFGGIDSKIHAARRDGPFHGARCISGPTHESLPPFSWSESSAFASISHDGVPEKFNFSWQYFEEP